MSNKTLNLEVREVGAGAEPGHPNRYSPIPSNGNVCSFTGLKHAKLYQILGINGLARPYVRVVNLRTPGAKRGQTLFHVGDMLRFLDGLATDQTGNRPGEGETINQKGGNHASQ